MPWVQADFVAGRVHHLLHLLLHCPQCHPGKRFLLLACLWELQSAAYPDVHYTAGMLV